MPPRTNSPTVGQRQRQTTPTTRMQLCIIYGNQFRVNINTVAIRNAKCKKIQTANGERQATRQTPHRDGGNTENIERKRREIAAGWLQAIRRPSNATISTSTYLVLLKCLLSSRLHWLHSPLPECQSNRAMSIGRRIGLLPCNVAFWSQNCGWSRARLESAQQDARRLNVWMEMEIHSLCSRHSFAGWNIWNNFAWP